MNASYLQAMVDGMGAQWMKDRAETQMTLGKLIAALEELPADMLIDGIHSPHSYRGYYSDLAFESASDKVTAGKALEMCRGAMGRVFQGYKGGDFMMGEATPVWLAEYGSCGLRIMDLRHGGEIETAPDES